MRKEEEDELEENYTHMCKICKKKFVSGRAFGGHMRIHGPVAMAAAAESNERKRSRAVPEVRARDVCEEKWGEEEEREEEEVEDEEEEGESDGYELRRHPRPSWRFAERDYSFLSGHGFDSKAATFLRKSRSCKVCGKEFWSWKSLLDHMKCHDKWEGDEQEEYSESGSESEDNEHPRENSSKFEGCMKGKRSKRPRNTATAASPIRPPQSNSNSVSEEEDMAICLVMLASGVDTCSQKLKTGSAEEESANSGSGGYYSKMVFSSEPKRNPKPKRLDNGVAEAFDDEGKKLNGSKYACTTCNKIFHSYQALGGHRASHKKVKGCSSRVEENEIENEMENEIQNGIEKVIENENENESLEEEITDEEQLLLTAGPEQQPPISFHKPPLPDEAATTPIPVTIHKSVPIPTGKKKLSTKVHECSICHRVFSTGQALGGHKRCHWGTGGASETTSTVSSTKETHNLQQQRGGNTELLDLNLPACPDDDDSVQDAIATARPNKLVMDSRRASDVEAHSKISMPLFQSWWADTHHPNQQGLFLYNNQSHLSPEDEVDSKLGSKIGLGTIQGQYLQNRAQPPWLQL
ncbi:hypothetical protein SUGI_0644930 [Cryptomeria japonica]|nr:hypothetical protein SUGI_0644930 [Cryptomeria japonica]